MLGGHNRFAGFRVPTPQAGVGSGGSGGGGGTPPTPPSDVTAAVPASKLISWGATGHVVSSPAQYQTWKTWGFAGHKTVLGGPYLFNFGGDQTMIGSTAAALGTSYNWQKAFEGLGVAAVNGNNTGLGPFKAKQADPSIEAYIGIYLKSNTTSATVPPFGDWFNDTTWAAVCTAVGNLAAGVKFLGGDGITLDVEDNVGAWQAPTTGGQSAAQKLVKIEQRGYEFGTALFTAFPLCKILVYSWYPNWGWHIQQFLKAQGLTEAANTDGLGEQIQFFLGFFRAMTTLSAVGPFYLMDATFYHDGTTSNSQVTGATMPIALKWNTQGILGFLSRVMPATTRDWMADKVMVSPFSWAGTDNTTFYNNNQLAEPAYANQQEQFRQYGMGGRRTEYTHISGASDDNRPSTVSGTGTVKGGATYGGIFPGTNQYGAVTGRAAGMLAAASTTSQNSTPPSLSTPTVSGSGTTRTITGTASHSVFGIAYVKAYIYPSGTAVTASMTWNLGGGGWTSLGNDYMDYSINLTGVTTGDYAIVTAYSTLGQQHSTAVAL